MVTEYNYKGYTIKRQLNYTPKFIAYRPNGDLFNVFHANTLSEVKIQIRWDIENQLLQPVSVNAKIAKLDKFMKEYC